MDTNTEKLDEISKQMNEMKEQMHEMKEQMNIMKEQMNIMSDQLDYLRNKCNKNIKWNFNKDTADKNRVKVGVNKSAVLGGMIPGLPQFINNQPYKGILMFMIEIIFIWMTLLFGSWDLVIGLIAYHILSAIDAYNCAWFLSNGLILDKFEFCILS